MQAERGKIVKFLDEYLKIDGVKDSSTNGLQVIGKDEVKKVAIGVTASGELFKKSAARKADMIIVHHGLFWSHSAEEDKFSVDQAMKQRLQILFENNISLLAYHLPLDMHPEAGNNIQIAKKLGLSNIKKFGKHYGQYVGFSGEIKEVSLDDLVKKTERIFGAKQQVFAFGKAKIKKVAIVSGGSGGMDFIKQASLENADVYIIGNPFEPTPDYACDAKINMIAGGHRNTEKFGVQTIGELLREKFGVAVEFIDVPCDI